MLQKYDFIVTKSNGGGKISKNAKNAVCVGCMRVVMGL